MVKDLQKIKELVLVLWGPDPSVLEGKSRAEFSGGQKAQGLQEKRGAMGKSRADRVSSREVQREKGAPEAARGLCLGHDQSVEVWHGARQIPTGAEETGLGAQTPERVVKQVHVLP